MTDIQKFFKEHSILATLIMMLTISFVILFIVFMLIKVYARQGKEFELPEMVNCNIEEIRAQNDLNLDFVILDSTYHSGVEGGVILTQDPKAHTMIKKGRKVYLTITAFAPGNVLAPDVTSISVKQAVKLLYSKGLKCGRLTFVESEFRNVVIEQTLNGHVLKENENIPNGSFVDLVVGLGSGNANAVTPFVIGKNVNDARREITSASMNIGKEHFGGVKDRSKAVVVRQNPDYTGVTQYPYGTAVDLWYSDASKVDVDKMVREFKVDSSQIVDPQKEEDYIMEENEW